MKPDNLTLLHSVKHELSSNAIKMPPVITHVIHFGLDDRPKIIYVSRDFQALLGFAPEVILRGEVDFLAQIHRDDGDIIESLFDSNHVEKTGVFNIRIRHADGRIRCIKGQFERDSANNKLVLNLQDAKQIWQAQAHLPMMENFKSMMENTDDFIYFKDRNHVFTGASQTLVSITDPSEHWTDLLGKTDYDVFPEAYADVYYKLEKQVFSGISIAHEVQEFIDNHDNKGWVDNRKYPIRSEQGEVIGLFGIARDITQLKRFEQNLLVAAAAFEAQEGIVVTNADGKILRVNQAFSRITGYAADDVIGTDPSIFCGEGHFTDIWGQAQKSGVWAGEVWSRKKDGVSAMHHFTVTAVKDEHQHIVNYVITITEFTMSKAAADEIQNLAFYDPLTKLPNRRLLLDRLKHAMTNSIRSEVYGALLFLDLDHFKTLNDSLGHHMGDLFLQKVAERLSYSLREADTIAQIGRLGGDEFVVMLENLSAKDTEAASLAEVVATKVLSVLSQPYYLNNNEYMSTVSIGVTLFKGHDKSQQDLLRHADIAMYQAKKSGRNGVCFFDPKMQYAINERIELERELRKAIQKQQLELYYQVQIGHHKQVIGAEALIRWKHPEKGMISPGSFIPIAEETGLVLSIGQWVLETACQKLSEWQKSRMTQPLTLSINVSAKQFRHEQFVTQVAAAISKYGIDASKLKLELTESLLLENVDAAIRTMNELRELGILMSLDDFGTGYSSLQYLKKLPLYQLKIDQSFVRDIESDPNDKAIVRTIVAIAESMNLDVIAEGVETEAQQDFLLEVGCKQYQGYFFGRPLPIQEFENALV